VRRWKRTDLRADGIAAGSPEGVGSIFVALVLAIHGCHGSFEDVPLILVVGEQFLGLFLCSPSLGFAFLLHISAPCPTLGVIEADHEPTATGTVPTASAPVHITANGRRVTVADLLEAGHIQPGEHVEFLRPRLGERYDATIRSDGSFELPDGSVHQSPSLAAMRAADLVSYDGWHAWRIPRLGGTKLHELRLQFVADAEGVDGSDG
jgi:hypothetical protein